MSEADLTGPAEGHEPSIIVVPDSGTTRIGEDMILEPPRTGRNIIPPGPWVQTLMDSDSFGSAGRPNRPRSALVRDLRLLPSLREPFLRDSRAMTASALFYFLQSKPANVESGLMTVVGAEMPLEEECIHCKMLKGPWARCVVVQGQPGRGLACNNCHQLRRGSRCEHYVAPHPDTAEIPQPQRRQTQTRQDDEASSDRRAWILDFEHMGDRIEVVNRRILGLLDAHEDRDVQGHDIRELRRMVQRLQDAYRDLVRRRAEMDM
ncbi:hypothetical protein MYU51_014155 [Penicillium brevicompactum]|uniref:uncharacterized protein n=1 Tax=Penicillium brevicompactum TaxID=5074 RepID=UPI0025425F54|nr:uncharacterized protein N7506_007234 [Penicillium brevicompactum]KAJ5333451.1 hypothetical protein N7506_007234 [Penicillium brevicompactum]